MRTLLLATLLTAPTLLVSAAFAGPESGLDLIARPLVEKIDVSAAAVGVSTTVSLPVEELLATPTFVSQDAPQLDRDLASSEHPMIPLPSSAWIGITLLAGVAIYAIRQQRNVRFH